MALSPNTPVASPVWQRAVVARQFSSKPVESVRAARILSFKVKNNPAWRLPVGVRKAFGRLSGQPRMAPSVTSRRLKTAIEVKLQHCFIRRVSR